MRLSRKNNQGHSTNYLLSDSWSHDLRNVHMKHLSASISNIPGFAIVDCTLQPHAVLHGHSHQRLHLCVVSSGGFDEHSQRRTRWCSETTIRLSPPGEMHHIRVGQEGARCLLIEPLRPINARCTSSVYCDDTRLAQIGHELGQGASLDRGAFSTSMERSIRELFAQLQLQARGRQVTLPEWLRPVRDFLRERFQEPIRVDDIAQVAGVNPVHLIRAFRKNLGMTIGEYIRSHRVDLASKLLTSTDHPLACISADCGFSDQSHMTRIFRRALGVTPLQFRRQKPTL